MDPSSAAPTALSRLLEAHARLTSDLAGLLVDRGQSLSAAITARASAFRTASSSGLAVTAAREHASEAASRFDAEAADLTGQVDALRVQLHHIDQQLLYVHGSDGG